MSSFATSETNHPQAGLAVPATPKEVGDWLEMFDSVVAMTANSAASLTQTGSYAPPSGPGEAIGCCQHHVNLRIDPTSFGHLVAAPSDDSAGPDCLQLISADDQHLLHRGFVNSQEDRAVFRSLQMRGGRPWEPGSTTLWPQADGPCGAERARLLRADLVGHLDSILCDDGARGATLPTCGSELASSADVADGIHALRHLSELGVPVMFGVPVQGLMHTCAGVIDTMYRTRWGVSLQLGAATLGFEPEALGAVWITRPVGGPALVEFHDTAGRCVLVAVAVADYGSEAAIRWEHITAMLSLESFGNR